MGEWAAQRNTDSPLSLECSRPVGLTTPDPGKSWASVQAPRRPLVSESCLTRRSDSWVNQTRREEGALGDARERSDPMRNRPAVTGTGS